MSGKLRELIRAVRACKTAAEERDAVAKESAALREAFREQDGRNRHRNVAKLMYIHMLGYPTHFGQMETLKLIAANGFPEKRIGYLGLMILLDERQEVLMLVTNSLKMDLNHKNQYIVGLALAALGNICSTEMARDLAPDVEKLLESSNPYVRKKAAICAIRILKKVPELVESFMDRAVDLLNDKNHAVVLGGVSLMLTICEVDPSTVEKYRKHVPLLCKIQKSLLQSGFSPEHDVGGITDPFLQVKILFLLRLLGSGNSDASDQMSDILAQVASNVDANRNAGNAILYECVQTIMGIEAIGGLRVLAVNILGRFLSNKDNNIRYVALNTLAKVVAVDTQAVQRHRATIVDCVKDADVSIRRRALELVYSLVNENNIRTLTKELLDYLVVSDSEFKPDLTNKICALIQRYAPDKRWHIDSLVQVLVQAGPFVKEEAIRHLVIVIANATDLHAYAVRVLFRALRDSLDSAEPSLCMAALWSIGEYGDLLAQGGSFLDGESPLALQQEDVVNIVETLLKKPKIDGVVKEYAITALIKLTARLPSQVQRIRALVDKYTSSPLLEVQQRSCEYSQLFKYDRMRPQLLERMPALDEDFGKHTGDAAKATVAGSSVPVPPSAGGGDLLGLDGLGDVAPATGPRSAIDALDDLLGVGPTPAAAAPASASDLLDLLAAPAAFSAVNDPLAFMTTPAPAPLPFMAAPAPAAPAFPPFTAYNGHGITVTFACTKQPGAPDQTTVAATITNAGSTAIPDFVMQAAVPKFMTLRLEPASSTILPPFNGGTISQKFHIHNTMHGQKPVAVRLRMQFTMNGMPLTEMAEVANFPPGL